MQSNKYYLGILAGFVGLILTLTTTELTAQTIGANFTGSNRGQTGFIPPDTMGAVGANHVVELINGRFAAYDRAGNLQSSSTLDQFWTAAGVSPVSFSFDPRISYDTDSNRWIAAAVDNGRAANNFLVGVSDTDDPTAGWSAYSVDSDADDSHWADFPMLGINNDTVTIGANMFSLSGGTANTGFLVIDKASLLSGTPTFTSYEDVAPADTGFTPQPILDLTNSSGPMDILSSFNKTNGFLKLSSIDSTSLNTTGGFLTVGARALPGDIEKTGTETDIESGDSRFSG